VKTFIKSLLYGIVFILSSKADGQPKSSLFHNSGIYTSLQWMAGEDILITPQVWTYADDFYLEGRLNYEDRRTVSLFCGKSFLAGKNEEWEIIPMVGGICGQFQGIAPALTCLHKSKWLKGFSQSEFAVSIIENGKNFFFNWTGITTPLLSNSGIGISWRWIALPNFSPAIDKGVMFSVQKKPFTIEGFAYNFWQDGFILALGLEFDLK